MAWRKGNRLQMIRESQAPPQTRAIFQDMKYALGLPEVSEVAQALAAYPVFLDLYWHSFRPVVLSEEFFALGERLRADAYTRVFTYFAIADLRAFVPQTEAGRVDSFFELAHYETPLLLLLMAAQLQAFDAPLGRPGTSTRPGTHPAFANLEWIASEEPITPKVRRILHEMRRLGLLLRARESDALARWPRFLSAYWEVLKTATASPIHEFSLDAVRDTAFALARELPHEIDLGVDQMAESGMTDEDIASVVRIVETFIESLTRRLLACTIGRIALEGGSRVQRPRVQENHEEAAGGRGRAA